MQTYCLQFNADSSFREIETVLDPQISDYNERISKAGYHSDPALVLKGGQVVVYAEDSENSAQNSFLVRVDIGHAWFISCRNLISLAALFRNLRDLLDAFSELPNED